MAVQGLEVALWGPAMQQQMFALVMVIVSLITWWSSYVGDKNFLQSKHTTWRLIPHMLYSALK
jgi:hypothetical protein